MCECARERAGGNLIGQGGEEKTSLCWRTRHEALARSPTHLFTHSITLSHTHTHTHTRVMVMHLALLEDEARGVVQDEPRVLVPRHLQNLTNLYCKPGMSTLEESATNFSNEISLSQESRVRDNKFRVGGFRGDTLQPWRRRWADEATPHPSWPLSEMVSSQGFEGWCVGCMV